MATEVLVLELLRTVAESRTGVLVASTAPRCIGGRPVIRLATTVGHERAGRAARPGRDPTNALVVCEA